MLGSFKGQPRGNDRFEGSCQNDTSICTQISMCAHIFQGTLRVNCRRVVPPSTIQLDPPQLLPNSEHVVGKKAILANLQMKNKLVCRLLRRPSFFSFLMILKGSQTTVCCSLAHPRRAPEIRASASMALQTLQGFRLKIQSAKAHREKGKNDSQTLATGFTKLQVSPSPLPLAKKKNKRLCSRKWQTWRIEPTGCDGTVRGLASFGSGGFGWLGCLAELVATSCHLRKAKQQKKMFQPVVYPS